MRKYPNEMIIRTVAEFKGGGIVMFSKGMEMQLKNAKRTITILLTEDENEKIMNMSLLDFQRYAKANFFND